MAGLFGFGLALLWKRGEENGGSGRSSLKSEAMICVSDAYFID